MDLKLAIKNRDASAIETLIDKSGVGDVDIFFGLISLIHHPGDRFCQILKKAVDKNRDYLTSGHDKPLYLILRDISHSKIVSVAVGPEEFDKIIIPVTVDFLDLIDVFDTSYLTINLPEETLKANAFQEMACFKPEICLAYLEQNFDKAEQILTNLDHNFLEPISNLAKLRVEIGILIEKNKLQSAQSHYLNPPKNFKI